MTTVIESKIILTVSVIVHSVLEPKCNDVHYLFAVIGNIGAISTPLYMYTFIATINNKRADETQFTRHEISVGSDKK